MAKKQNVSFRRVHGRIIPIKISSVQKRDAKQGVALVAGGAATGFAAGKLHRGLVRYANAGGVRAFNSLTKLDRLKKIPQPSLFAEATRNARIGKVIKLSSKLSASSARLGRLAPGIRLGGIAASSALIGAGAAKLYKARREKTSKTNLKYIGATAGTAAFLTGAYGGAGARSALKGAYVKAYPVLRAMKGKFKL